MSRYEREEYENWDEYEDEEQEEEGVGEDEYEEEEEEDPQPTQQELEYLELRKQLKDSIRKQIKKENGTSLGHSQERKKLPCDNYGSFFGPSRPVIAQRVIQESKSLLENERLTAKVLKPNHSSKNSASASSSGSKKQIHNSHPKVVNEMKSKVQKLKVARDYSFLLSDDAELPAPIRGPSRNVSGGPTSDARSAQVTPKNKQLLDRSGRQVSNGSSQSQNETRQGHDGSRQVHSASRQVQNGSRQGEDKSRQSSDGSRRVHNGSRQGEDRSREVSNGNRQVSNGNRQVSNGSRQVSNGSRHVSDGSRQVSNGSRQGSDGSRQGSNGSRQVSNGREEKRNVASDSRADPRAAPHKLNTASKPISKPVDSRKQPVNNGSGTGRPLSSSLPSKVPSGSIQKRVPSAGAKSSFHNVPKPSSTKLQSSTSKQPMTSKQMLDRSRGYQDSSKGKIISKQAVASSQPQVSKPSTKVPSRPTFQKDGPKKRPARPFSDDEDDLGGGSGVTSMIQKLMGYNPNKYKGRDSDDSDMEANFDDILREERRSAKIAKMEDEEELKKIEEEERRERLRKEAKKRKLSHR